MSEETLAVAVPDVSPRAASSDEEWNAKSKAFGRELEKEFGIPFEESSIGFGAAYPAWVGALDLGAWPYFYAALFLFLKGEKIEISLDAWIRIFKEKVAPLFKRQVYLNRAAAAILAINEIASILGDVPKSIQLVGYRRMTWFDKQDGN